MVAGALLVLFGVIYLTNAVAAVDQQAADLDPSESRLEQTFLVGAWGLTVAGVGLAVFLIGVVPYAVSAHRVSRQGLSPTAGPRVLSIVAACAVGAAVLFTFVAPNGPFVHAASLASGGGGPGGAVQLETFDGGMTAAGAAGRSSDERIHPFTPVASYGAIKLKFAWGGAEANGNLVAILEAADGSGGWNEVASTDGSNQSEIDVPAASYPGDLRVRVVMTGPGLGQASYEGAISFDPTP